MRPSLHRQFLPQRCNTEIRIAHYPPYTSKYNPIEHRLFPQVSRACRVFLPSQDRASRHGQSLNLNRVNRGRFHFGQGLSNWSNGN
ncbi:MAG: hypothetical protein AAFO87_06200 [Cyanobacteria bacterium J06607_6]